jgi:hypothetical protein
MTILNKNADFEDVEDFKEMKQELAVSVFSIQRFQIAVKKTCQV